MGVKRLPRLKVCTLFKIKAPMWKGGEHMVGLNLKRITEDNEIVFTYRRKSDNEMSFPDPYYFDGNKLNEIDYDKKAHKGTVLVYIPFTDLEKLERI